MTNFLYLYSNWEDTVFLMAIVEDTWYSFYTWTC